MFKDSIDTGNNRPVGGDSVHIADMSNAREERAMWTVLKYLWYWPEMSFVCGQAAQSRRKIFVLDKYDKISMLVWTGRKALVCITIDCGVSFPDINVWCYWFPMPYEPNHLGWPYWTKGITPNIFHCSFHGPVAANILYISSIYSLCSINQLLAVAS